MAGGQPYTDEDDETLRRIHAEWQGAYGWLTAASKAMGRSASTLSHRWSLIKAKEGRPAPSETEPTEQTVESAIANRITSLDELLKQSKTDRDLWEVERHVINKWEVGAKHPTTGQILTAPLWQVKAWLKKIPGASHAKLTRELLADIQADTKRRAKPGASPKVKRSADAHCLEVDEFDIHLNKLAWAAETGQNFDSEIAEGRARAAMLDLLESASPFAIDRVILPIGNDLTNADNLLKQTTGGTPQDTDTRYHRMFRRARMLTSWMIAECAKIAPVEVVIVPGNHDELTSWTVGQVLEAEYAGDRRITFQSGPKLRKYVHYGNNLIGFTHGCDEPHGNLPQIMAVEQAAIWSQTTYREWHVGHLHKQKAIMPVIVDDKIGVTVRVIRALSGTDAWHFRKGYVGGAQGAEAFVWKKSGGLRAHLYHYSDKSA